MSRPFTFVHAADIHLDTPFENVGRAPDEISEVIRDASLRAWQGLVDLTIERDAAFLLLAGDIYEGAEHGIRAQLHFRRGLERLAERQIQVFVIHGNHDPLEGWAAIETWPRSVTLFGASEVGSVPAVRDGRHLATVHGISYARRDCDENLALRFVRGRERGLHIGLLHANAGSNPAHPLCAPCTVDDLRRATLDYWALGHVHQRSYPSRGAPWVVYPGNLQSWCRSPGELGAKGAVVVEADEDRILRLEFAALDSVRFLDVEVDVSGTADLASLREFLGARAEELVELHAGRSLLLTAVLIGCRAPALAAASAEWREELLDALRRESAARSPFLWWAAIEDLSTPEIEPALLERGDLVAALLGRAERLAAEPAERSRFLEERCEPLLRKWVAEVEPDEAEALLGEARDLAFELLGRPRPR